jgi:hypothetical protein
MEELGNKKLTSYVKDAGKRGRKMRHNDVEVNTVGLYRNGDPGVPVP